MEYLTTLEQVVRDAAKVTSQASPSKSHALKPSEA
jgi:hypothetical protein